MTWKVYFEIYGRRMRTIITAPSASEAAAKVREKLIINKAIRNGDEYLIEAELYNRTMEKVINARDIIEAVQLQKTHLIIHKVERIRDETPFDDIFRQFGFK